MVLVGWLTVEDYGTHWIGFLSKASISMSIASHIEIRFPNLQENKN